MVGWSSGSFPTLVILWFYTSPFRSRQWLYTPLLTKPFDEMKVVVRHFSQFKFTGMSWKWVNRWFVTCHIWPSAHVRWSIQKCNFALLRWESFGFVPGVSEKPLSLSCALNILLLHVVLCEILNEREDFLHWINFVFCSVLVCCSFEWWECQKHIWSLNNNEFLILRSSHLPFGLHVSYSNGSSFGLVKNSRFFVCGVYLYDFCAQSFLLWTHITHFAQC